MKSVFQRISPFNFRGVFTKLPKSRTGFSANTFQKTSPSLNFDPYFWPKFTNFFNFLRKSSKFRFFSQIGPKSEGFPLKIRKIAIFSADFFSQNRDSHFCESRFLKPISASKKAFFDVLKGSPLKSVFQRISPFNFRGVFTKLPKSRTGFSANTFQKAREF